MSSNNSAYLKHILDSINALERYTTSHNLEQFLANDWDQAAVEKHLEIIAEAANQIDQKIKDQNSQIPWRKIVNFRNILIHVYFEVDLSVVWEILQKDISPLKKEIEKLSEKY